MLRIASWNVNSLKVRFDQVIDWFEAKQIDILALQETKLTDENFPKQALLDKGYHVAFSGQKTFNGVAIISRQTISEVVTDIFDYPDPQRRLLAASIGDIRVINLYVPNGAAVDTDKYIYKLDWLDKVTAYIQQQMQQYSKLVVLGDFNVAPEDQDVHDPTIWQGSILVSQPERDALNNLLKLGLKDSFRLFNQPEQQFSWWDYRQAAFRRNRGLRIDLILISQSLQTNCIESLIDAAPRRHQRPSDHAPVWVSLTDPS